MLPTKEFPSLRLLFPFSTSPPPSLPSISIPSSLSRRFPSSFFFFPTRILPGAGAGSSHRRRRERRRRMFENSAPNMTPDTSACASPTPTLTRNQASKPPKPVPVKDEEGPKEKQLSDVDILKERFAKLLLGEDMSGGGKGVSSALALSNAITNLAASIFGEQKRLEPMAPERRARWRKEIDWLLSVADHIVELVPSKQKSKDGSNMEIMTTRQRNDLHLNIPALRKLDAMLMDCLDNFKEQNEFTYEKRDDDTKRQDDKWWIPTPKVPANGLSDVTRKWLQFQKDSVNQVLKAAMAINAQVISEMAIPEDYIESLPKNGRSSLGESIYRSITVDDYFDPEHFLSTLDLSSELKILDLKNRIEASIMIWRRKMNAKDGKSPWGSAVSFEKRELFEDRAETVLLIIKHRFPGIPQSSLEISKIQYNRDVGQAILESYSRVLESLASTVMSRIEDVLHADSVAQNPSLGEQKRNPLVQDTSLVTSTDRFPSAQEELEKLNSAQTPSSMTLSDFMGWTSDHREDEPKTDPAAAETHLCIENEKKCLTKTLTIVTSRKFSYIEKLENSGGLRSPTARH
ncbi:rop guanine nucleotide exchange factor 9-like [Diospyros lotus]|uniref:rop guanine nucleotide exchange factor 9-like n=1 Tax=Diospyros lotus TaxID=55363 RepID=UPI002253CB9B|nr:rop guanine nucleotide exchange factor 9-like [Diospyros lotus]